MLLCPWDFPGKSTGVGCQFLLQKIFLTQGLNPGLPHCRQTLYPPVLFGNYKLLFLWVYFYKQWNITHPQKELKSLSYSTL